MLDTHRKTASHRSQCSLCDEFSEHEPCYFNHFRSQFTEHIEADSPDQLGWLLTRCGSCGVVGVDPLPTEEELQDLYNTGYYTEDIWDKSIGAWMMKKSLAGVADRWPWSRQSRMRTHAKEIQHLKNIEELILYPSRPVSFLDVGCGLGESLAAAEDMGWNGLGIEISHSAAERARQASNMPVICTSWDQVSLNNQLFDIIHLREVLEHSRNPGALLARLFGWLRPGGVLYIQVPNDFEGYRTFLFRNIWWMFPPTHLHYFTLGILSEAIEELGLEMIKSGSIADAIGLDLRRYFLWRFGILDYFDRLQGEQSFRAVIYKLFQIGWDHGLFWPLKTILNRTMRGFTFWLIARKPIHHQEIP